MASSPPRRGTIAPRPARVHALALATALGLTAAPPARATWSVVAVDPATREVGVAGASCIGGVEMIGSLVPGRGAVVSQAMASFAGRDRIAALVASGLPAGAAVEAVASSAFDTLAGVDTSRLRQYGAVSLDGPEAAAFTGRWAFDWAGSVTGPDWSVQGNLLVGPEVVARAAEAFEAGPRGCTPTLADRLVSALLAGAEAGGDRRCVPGLAALSAFVAVSGPQDPPGRPDLELVRTHPTARRFGPATILHEAWRMLSGPSRGGRIDGPVWLLRGDYEAWARQRGRPACLATEAP